ncbi:MAG: gamma-glutamyltransferase [Phycisphaerales bacterium]
MIPRIVDTLARMFTTSKRWGVLVGLVCVAIAFGGCYRPLTTRSFHADVYDHGGVACDHYEASRAGAYMLRWGGNAVDAAVAASFALSVVRPHSCGLGGGGFMLIRLVDDPNTAAPNDPVTIAIDYRERTPAAVGPDHFFDLPDDASRYSGHAVAVPGTVAGLLDAHERYGTLPLARVLGPAIALAFEGYAVDRNAEASFDELRDHLDAYDPPGEAWMRRTYTGRTTRDVQNPRQGRLLSEIVARGRDAFYLGDNARHIVHAVRNAGGVMTLEDLAAYEPVVIEPLVRTIDFGGEVYTVIAMPPPSSGGVAILQTLAMLSIYDAQMRGHVGWGILDAAHPHDPGYAHALVECLKHAFADRARHMGDTEFVEVPIDQMLDPARLERAVTILNPDYTLPTERYGVADHDGAVSMALDDHGTSHLSVIDRWGNAVACTETINLVFGSRIAVPELGIVLNNEMDDFLTKVGEGNAFGLVQSERNLPAPGKRPLSSMSPTIVLDADGEVLAVAGASGGPRIITGTLQALINALHFGMDAFDAVETPRLHHQWAPEAIYYEPDYDASTLEALRALGHECRERPDVGVVQLLVRRNGVIEAASDPRKGGRPAGE